MAPEIAKTLRMSGERILKRLAALDGSQSRMLWPPKALHAEEAKLHRQLTAVQGAIVALNRGGKTAISLGHTSTSNGGSGKRTMSAFVRARISRSAKARWAKIHAEKAKKAK
jgi:hypothetical protein